MICAANPKPQKKKKLKMVDLFCGAGGTTTGAVEGANALGFDVEMLVVNHDRRSIETHKLNHPEATHLCTGVDDVEPRSLFKRGELDILLASPECTNHSKAKGGKPKDDQSRASGWCILKWAEQVAPRIIIIENVWEYTDWGPIGSNGKPLKSKKGATFRAWVETLRSLGYKLEWRKRRSADFGDPTTRERLVIICVLGKRKCVWPDRTHAPWEHVENLETHGDLFSLKLRPWVPARDIIDWRIKGDFIFNRKRSLAEKTLARIIIGLEKQDLEPFILPGFGERENQKARMHTVEDPLPTLCAGGHFALVDPYILAMEHGGKVDEIGKPLRTITTARGGAMAVVEPAIVELRGTSPSQVSSSMKSLEDPLGTVTAGGTHHALLEFESYLVQVAHGNGKDKNGDARRVKSLDSPLPTVCGNGGDMALIEPMLLGQQSGAAARMTKDQVPTIATSGAISLIEPVIVKFYDTASTEAASPEPPTEVRIEVAVEINGKHYAVCCIDGVWCLLCRRQGVLLFVAIRFRMLQPHELALAQGFRKDYRFASRSKTVQVKQIGNAVTRRLARAHVVALLSQDPDVSWLIEEDEALEQTRGAA